jgi:hypothetical protein
MDQNKDQEHERDRQSDEARLLTLSDLKYIGVATEYVRITGRENQPYTIVGATIDLPIPVKLQRKIRQVSILLGRSNSSSCEYNTYDGAQLCI